MCATSCEISRRRRCLGAIRMLVSPQSMWAQMLCISPFLSRIWTSWMMCAESGVSVLHRYRPNIPALRLSRMTLGFREIWWGWTSSKVAISACPPNFSIPSSILSNLPRHARYRARYTSHLLVECQRIVGAWFGDCHLCHLCLCICHLQAWVYHGSSTWSISGIGRFYDCSCMVGISHCLSLMHKSSWLPMIKEVDLSRRRMTYRTFRAWMGS